MSTGPPTKAGNTDQSRVKSVLQDMTVEIASLVGTAEISGTWEERLESLITPQQPPGPVLAPAPRI